MRKITCPTCGKAGSVPDSFTGQSIRCPSCKQAIALVSLDVSEPDAVPDAPQTAVAALPSGLRRVPREQGFPWFFGVLEALVAFILVVAILAMIYFVLVVIGIIAGVNPEVAFVAAILSLGVILSSLILAALLQLLIDIARSLRLIRGRLPIVIDKEGEVVALLVQQPDGQQ